MMRVLFVCVGNSGRSQMAEAFANKLGEGRVIAESAGTNPSDELDPTVVEVMKEIGYDITLQRPKMLTLEMVDRADKIITMGCGVSLDYVEHQGGACPASFLETEDWGLEDPKGQPIEKVREIRDEIKSRVERLIEDITIV
jgi:protein-tyrosine-phosphatase